MPQFNVLNNPSKAYLQIKWHPPPHVFVLGEKAHACCITQLQTSISPLGSTKVINNTIQKQGKPQLDALLQCISVARCPPCSREIELSRWATRYLLPKTIPSASSSSNPGPQNRCTNYRIAEARHRIRSLVPVAKCPRCENNQRNSVLLRIFHKV